MAKFKGDRISDWKREQAIKMREENNMTYQQIAQAMGVSRAYIGILLRDYNKNKNFHIVTEESIPYPRLAQWMNENQVSQYELARKVGYAPGCKNYHFLTDKMERGTLKKQEIDRLIEITGIDYEDLFWRQ